LVPFDKFSAGVTEYVVHEMLPYILGGNPFVAGMASYLVAERGPALLKPMLESPVAKALGIADEKGNVDLDLLYAAAKDAMSKTQECVIDLPFGKIKLKAADIEKLNQLCRGTGETK